MGKDRERIFVPAAHALQPQRRLYHRELASAKLDPKGEDWMEKTTQECYKPLALVQKDLDPRLGLSLDVYGILRMQIKDGQVRREIRESLKANGMGDSFIHPILPFLEDDDKRVLIKAGLRALSKEGIKPKIFWAPESALDNKTVDVVKECGYQGILLSPVQVRRADGGNTDNYPMVLPNGLIAIPFDSKVHSEVSFEDISNADRFVRNIVVPQAEKSPLGLVIAHTDLETFGHHRPWANLFLDYLLKNSLKENGFEVISINELFDRLISEKYNFPKGELIENRSWSCNHGIERWKRNCDCCGSSDGVWKGDFLDTFSWLNSTVKKIVRRELGGDGKKVESAVAEKFEDLLTNPGGSASDKDKSMCSADVARRHVYQSCSTFHANPSTAGWGSVGFGLEAIEHLHDAGLTKEASELRDSYLEKLNKVRVPYYEKKLDEVAYDMLGEKRKANF